MPPSRDVPHLRILPAGPSDIDALFGVYAELATDGDVEPQQGKTLRQTFTEDNPSRRLYESVGFQVIGAIPSVHGDEGALIYWRDLAPKTSGSA